MEQKATKETKGAVRLGWRTQLQDSTGTYKCAYYDDGTMQSVADAAGKRMTYTYAAAGNRRTLINPDGGSVTYNYDETAYMNGELTKGDAAPIDWLSGRGLVHFTYGTSGIAADTVT
jgi:YD repeat-containing protein